MASTESRSGFRPPWALHPDTEPGDGEASDANQVDQPDNDATTPDEATLSAVDTGAPADAADAADAEGQATTTRSTAPPVEARPANAEARPAGGPTKFQVDLARAMRAAADGARAETIEGLTADSKARIEAIRAGGTGTTTELRRHADDDIARIREWSKAEIARIRTETDTRIADRKEELDHQIGTHDAGIEALVEAVAKRVAAFEANLDAFFEVLSRDDDPTRIAAMAQALPEAPDLNDVAIEAVAGDVPPWPIPVTDDGVTDVAAIEVTVSEPTPWAVPVTDDAGDDGSDGALPDEDFAASVDRRLQAFGLDPASAAEAEAEAGSNLPNAAEIEAAAVRAGDDGSAGHADEQPTIAAVLEAPAKGGESVAAEGEPAEQVRETTVVVDGLVSVASIATFKRNVGRLEGVSSVTVTSGPDGEFLFAVKHETYAAIEAGLPGMPGFGVRVLEAGNGTIRLSAHDPETVADAAAKSGSRS